MQNRFQDAEWIFVADVEETVCNSYFDYVAEFEPKGEGRVTLFVSASTLYALYVNGQFVDCGQYPGYEDYQVYDEVDITDYLKKSQNQFKITQYVVGENFSTHRIQKPGVIFALWQENECLLNSDTDCLSRVNPYYHSGDMEKVSPQLGYTFRYNACATELPYQRSVLSGKDKALYERPIRKLPIDEQITGRLRNQGNFCSSGEDKPIGKIMQDSYLASRTKNELMQESRWHTEEDADGVYFVFDMGEETVGFLDLDFEVPNECQVLIGFGEHLEDLHVRSFIEPRNFCVGYHAKAGRNQFFHPFMRLGLRYLQVHIYSKEGVLHTMGIRKTWYPVSIHKPEISDALYNKIYDISIRTLQLCMHEHYEDCPWREQALYALDSRIQMLCGYYIFQEYDFVKASLRLMALSIREDGMLELCPPGKVPLTIPSFTTAFVRQMWEYLEYSKDVAFVAELFDKIKTVVTGFELRIENNGLIPCYQGKEYWNFYEWTQGLSGGEFFITNPPYECALNAFVSDVFYCFARICETIRPELAAHYDELHKKINKAIHQHFFDSKRQLYINRLNNGEAPEVCSTGMYLEVCERVNAFTQALVLYVGAVPEELIPVVTENMLYGDLVPCTLSTNIYKYDVLLKQGNIWHDYIKKEVEQIWGNMLFQGASSFWEVEDGASAFDDAGSLCHGWSAVPIYIYHRLHKSIRKGKGKYDNEI